MLKCTEIILHALFRHSSCRDLLCEHLIVMDSLPSRRDLHSPEQKIETQCVSCIRRIIHRIERPFLRRIMGHKYEITVPFFLRILTDQLLFLRFQVKWIPHLMPVLLRHGFFDLTELHCRDLISLRQRDTKNLKLTRVILR